MTTARDNGPKTTEIKTFQRKFPLEILTKIIAKTDRETLFACLRVSDQWFHLAGEVLYSDVTINMYTTAGIFQGAEITEDSEQAHQTPNGKTNFKRHLLGYVHKITITRHKCPTDTSDRSALTEAVKLMSNLQQTILNPQAGFSSTKPLCSKTSDCPILAGIKSDSVTIHNIRRQGANGGPLDLFTPIFDHVKHATLVIQPLASYIGKGGLVDLTRKNGRPQDLAVPTRKLDSVRILVAMSGSEIESMEGYFGRAAHLSKVGPLQEFLARFINLNQTRIEIYMFNKPSHLGSRKTTLDQFKEQLAAKVDQHYQSSINKSTEADKLEGWYSSWVPNYQVFDIERYFAQPSLSRELEAWMLDDWQRDLDWDRVYERGREEKAEQEANASRIAANTAEQSEEADKSRTSEGLGNKAGEATN